MPHVRKTVLAEQDLDDIWFSIALDNPDVADALLDRIGGVSVLLAENREMGRARPELLDGLRSFPVGNYIAPVLLHVPAPIGWLALTAEELLAAQARCRTATRTEERCTPRYGKRNAGAEVANRRRSRWCPIG